MPTAVGLDFGTTNCALAIARENQPIRVAMFRATEGSLDTYRSVLYFERKRPACAGPTAIERYLAATEKGRLIQSLKSFLASRSFRVTNVFGQSYSVEDLVTIMLRNLWREAEEEFGSFSGPVVVGRPVHFAHADTEQDNEFAIERMTKALTQAGIGPVVFEYEPVAAAYFYEASLDHDELVMTGDFGGDTSDFSLLRMGPSMCSDATSGTRILGTAGVGVAGDVFDGAIIRNLVSPELGRDTQYRSVDKSLPMPVWVYSELERWHYPQVQSDACNASKHSVSF